MSFEKYNKPRTRKGGTCAKCGGPAQGRVVLVLQQRKKNPGKAKGDANNYMYPSIDSHSRTMCEPCAIRVYEAAKSALLDGETR